MSVKTLNLNYGNSGYVTTDLLTLNLSTYQISFWGFYTQNGSNYTYITNQPNVPITYQVNNDINVLTNKEVPINVPYQATAILTPDFSNCTDYDFSNWAEYSNGLIVQYNGNLFTANNVSADHNVLCFLEPRSAPTTHTVVFRYATGKTQLSTPLTFTVIDSATPNNYYSYGASTLNMGQYVSYTVGVDNSILIRNISYDSNYVFGYRTNLDNLTYYSGSGDIVIQSPETLTQVNIVMFHDEEQTTHTLAFSNHNYSNYAQPISFRINSQNYYLENNTLSYSNVVSNESVLIREISYNSTYNLSYSIFDSTNNNISGNVIYNNEGNINISNINDDFSVKFYLAPNSKNVTFSYIGHDNNSSANEVDISFYIDNINVQIGKHYVTKSLPLGQSVTLTNVSYNYNNHGSYALTYSDGALHNYVPNQPIAFTVSQALNNVVFYLNNEEPQTQYWNLAITNDDVNIITFSYYVYFPTDPCISTPNNTVPAAIAINNASNHVVVDITDTGGNYAISSYEFNNNGSVYELDGGTSIGVPTTGVSSLNLHSKNIGITNTFDLTFDFCSYTNLIQLQYLKSTGNNWKIVTQTTTYAGTIQPDGTISVKVKQIISGYEFDHWIINGNDVTVNNWPHQYAITNINENTTVAFSLRSTIPTTPFFISVIKFSSGATPEETMRGFAQNADIIRIEKFDDDTQFTEYIRQFNDSNETFDSYNITSLDNNNVSEVFKTNTYYKIVLSDFDVNPNYSSIDRTIYVTPSDPNYASIQKISNNVYKCMFTDIPGQTINSTHIEILELFTPKTQLRYSIINTYTNLYLANEDMIAKNQFTSLNRFGDLNFNLEQLYNKGYRVENIHLWKKDGDIYETFTGYSYSFTNANSPSGELSVIPEIDNQEFISYIEFITPEINDYYTGQDLIDHTIQHNYGMNVVYKRSQINIEWNPKIVIG